MARIRTTKPDFWTSEQIVECSPIARLLFIGLWNFCDDGGVHPASYRRLKMEVLPADDDAAAAIHGWVEELKANDLVVEFEHEGKVYWYVTGWKHQKIDRPNYRYPGPLNYDNFVDLSSILSTDTQRSLFDPSSNDRRPLVEHSPPEGKGRERKGKDRERRARRWLDEESVPDDWIAWAVEHEGLTKQAAQREAAVFVDHWRSTPGQKGRKNDWLATWRNWIRRSKEFSGKNGGQQPQSDPELVRLRKRGEARGLAPQPNEPWGIFRYRVEQAEKGNTIPDDDWVRAREAMPHEH